MSEPSRQLQAVGEANRTMHGVAEQALEWVKVSEQRVAAAEQRSEKVRAELKERAMETLRGISAEARTRIAAEREKRGQVEASLVAAKQSLELAEQGRDRAEKAFEDAQQSSQDEREKLVAHAAVARKAAEKTAADAVAKVDTEISAQVATARGEIQTEADRRVAAAEQRAAEAEAAAAEAHEASIRLETEIERRVMEGTEDVRREAQESVRNLLEKVEREAEEAARARAEDQLRQESDRIKVQAQRREERAREGVESEIKASVSKARREAQAAAEESAPSWLRAESAGSTAGYRTF